MKYTLLLVLVNLAVQLSVAPPVTQNKQNDQPSDMEYQRYLLEVIEALESDGEFRAKLLTADQEELRSGKVAEKLEFVSHKVRSKLDELKREELERLRHLATKENELMNGLDFDHLKIAEHLDHTNTRTFEVEDLKKLIAKTSKDLAEGDRKRMAQFKEREMEKKFEEQEKMKHMNDSERKKYEEELQAMQEKQKHHEAVHHPGSKQQLEDVWEAQDQMGNQDFNPRTFFYLHDVDGNGFWDQDEVKALFLKELDKLYNHGTSPDNLIKRSEEMERMREHVFNEVDLNKDGLISYEEFIEETKKPNFETDEGWKGLDEQQIYTQEEFEAFEKRKQEEIQRMIAKGMPPPYPGNVPVHHEPFPPQYVNVPVDQGVAPPQYQAQHHEQYQQQQQYQNQVPMQQMHGQIPQQEYRQQVPHHQIPEQQYHQPQMQQHYQEQMHPQAVGQQQVYQGQAPVQHQQVPVQQQVPAQQHQVPVQQHQVPVQQQQVPVQQQQVPVQQAQGHQAQVPAQQQQQQRQQQQQQTFQQAPNQANTMNQVPQGNVGSQHSNENSGKQAQQRQQPAGQAGVNRNDIHTAGKV